MTKRWYEGQFSCYMHRERVAMGPDLRIVRIWVEDAARNWMREPRVMVGRAEILDAGSGERLFEACVWDHESPIEWIRCDETAGQDVAANCTEEVWYGELEGGEAVGTGDQMPDADGECPAPSIRCACVRCLADRAAIRETSLHGVSSPKAGRRDAWADRSWDGPLADFPGQSHKDTAERTRRTRWSKKYGYG